MAVQLGAGGLYGLATMAFGISSIVGYVSPKFETLALSGKAQFDEEMNQAGNVDQLVGVNRGITCQFRFKPRGTSIANARTSLGIPDICAGVTITGLDVVKAYGFTDVFNTDSGNTQPWIFSGEFSIDPTSTGLWTASITLVRHLLITSATAIS